MKFRVGNGYDTHPLLKGETLILGGTEIPYKKGIEGHSDGDVLVHAIIDSLLGAMSLNDIGTLFPSSNSKYKNISSLKLLKEVLSILNQKKYSISNIDATIILEEPTLKKYINKMRQSIANCLEININEISIKATTNDKLGFIGEGKGISCLVTALIMK
jgi:2-C-methyl-D-erythritol 2,4-cyclodiphosphate synthase